MIKKALRWVLVVWVACLFDLPRPCSGAVATVAAPLAPNILPGLAYTNAFFPGSDPDPSLPTPKTLLGFDIGERAATSGEIERCLRAWAAASAQKSLLVEYARSHEDRPLHYLVITSPRNRARLDEIQAGLLQLGDPRNRTEAEIARLTASLPAVAWLGYCIHGDETEGSDAALAVIHHLLADRTPETLQMLEDLVILIDPLQNPDGRDRYLKMIAEHRGANPNVDSQSLLHSGYWPRGRGNHYLFDLNRDWIFATQPETRGRLRAVARWNPLLFVDIHGMSGEDTYLFSPPREPMNGHFPANRTEWGRVFARDQAEAFDSHGWVYYTGEWNEGWYPGYSDAWSVFRGAVGILYEVASIGQDGVRHADGRIQSQRESIHQHIASSIANLKTLQRHARTRLREFSDERKINVSAEGPYANRTWAILPSPNRSRLQALIDTLQIQGVEIHQLPSERTVALATDSLGQVHTNRVLPPQTLLIANRQPTAPLVATLLQFDPHMSDVALENERREILRTGSSRIYDTTAWNLTQLYGLEALELPQPLPVDASVFSGMPPLPAPPAVDKPVAWVIDGDSDSSVAVAARLMERGVQVRVAQKPFQLDTHRFARGSVVILTIDNRRFHGDLAETIRNGARELALEAVPVRTGIGVDDLPDLGGENFRPLKQPRIAIAARGRVSSYDFGASWFLMDHFLGIRHSHITDGDSIPDLSRYNVLLLPDRFGPIPPAWREPLSRWVKSGGTLIAVEGSAADLVSRTNELTRVRPLPKAFGELAEYEQAVFREWLAQHGPLPQTADLWSHRVPPARSIPGFPATLGAGPKEEELQRRDNWNRLFMPQGALLAARTDPQHWLTFGVGALLPVLAGNQEILMSGSSSETPARFGILRPLPTAVAKPDASGTNTLPASEIPRAGWCALPENHELQLRMSGLLWPEAGQRFANSAAVTREALDRGQVILFAGPPHFRAATRGTARLLANALIYGPGFGTRPTVQP